MGTHGRSTEQFGIWQAVFSPVGADDYWKPHYDLRYILERDIATLGPKLAGKIHLAAGDMDTWYLNNAVHLMQDFLDAPKTPFRIADFEYRPGKPHCYMGGGDISTTESRGTVYQRIHAANCPPYDQYCAC